MSIFCNGTVVFEVKKTGKRGWYEMTSVPQIAEDIADWIEEEASKFGFAARAVKNAKLVGIHDVEAVLTYDTRFSGRDPDSFAILKRRDGTYVGGYSIAAPESSTLWPLLKMLTGITEYNTHHFTPLTAGPKPSARIYPAAPDFVKPERLLLSERLQAQVDPSRKKTVDDDAENAKTLAAKAAKAKAAAKPVFKETSALVGKPAGKSLKTLAIENKEARDKEVAAIAKKALLKAAKPATVKKTARKAK